MRMIARCEIGGSYQVLGRCVKAGGKHSWLYTFEHACLEHQPETKECSGEDGHKHVAKKMVDTGFGGRALEQYWRSCKESVEWNR